MYLYVNAFAHKQYTGNRIHPIYPLSTTCNRKEVCEKKISLSVCPNVNSGRQVFVICP